MKRRAQHKSSPLLYFDLGWTKSLRLYNDFISASFSICLLFFWFYHRSNWSEHLTNIRNKFQQAPEKSVKINVLEETEKNKSKLTNPICQYSVTVSYNREKPKLQSILCMISITFSCFIWFIYLINGIIALVMSILCLCIINLLRGVGRLGLGIHG